MRVDKISTADEAETVARVWRRLEHELAALEPGEQATFAGSLLAGLVDEVPDVVEAQLITLRSTLGHQSRLRRSRRGPLDDIHEPDRRLDHLVDYLEAENDPELDKWAVEALADARGLHAPVVADGTDHMGTFVKLGTALVDAVWDVARRPEDRRELLRAASRIVADLLGELEMWAAKRGGHAQ